MVDQIDALGAEWVLQMLHYENFLHDYELAAMELNNRENR